MNALDRVGLADRVDHRPGELSGGQQQRVAVARALVTDPDLILADEPTGNLDSVSARDVMDLLDELHRSGRTIVLITHDAEVAEAAGRTMRILDGQILDPDGRARQVPSMNVVETFRTGMEAVLSHRLRSALTVLGIMIGITAVILTVGLGEGAQKQVSSEITALGSNLLTVTPGSTTSSSGVRGGFGSASTLTSRGRRRPRLQGRGPRHPGRRPGQLLDASLVAGTTNWTTTVVGTDPSWLTVRGRIDDRGPVHRLPRPGHPGRGRRARGHHGPGAVRLPRSRRPDRRHRRPADVGDRGPQHRRLVLQLVDRAPTRTTRRSCR